MRAGSFANHRKRGDAAQSPAVAGLREPRAPFSVAGASGLGAFRRFAPPGSNHTRFKNRLKPELHTRPELPELAEMREHFAHGFTDPIFDCVLR
jgi:hypothetical protein